MNYYKVLKVDRKSTQDEIKDAYHKLALELHPDKHPEVKLLGSSTPDKQEYNTKFQEIQQAYSVLKDETSRRQYDLSFETTDWEIPKQNFTKSSSSFRPEPFLRTPDSTNPKYIKKYYEQKQYIDDRIALLNHDRDIKNTLR